MMSMRYFHNVDLPQARARIRSRRRTIRRAGTFGLAMLYFQKYPIPKQQIGDLFFISSIRW